MINRALLKAEIDRVHDKYLGALYRIIKSFESSADSERFNLTSGISVSEQGWLRFVEETYGCLANDPIERGNQGDYEVREEIE